MTRIRRWVFPHPVKLPLGSERIFHTDLIAALGYPSRQLLALWRIRYGFPESIKQSRTSFVFTRDLVKWLNDHGVNVEQGVPGKTVFTKKLDYLTNFECLDFLRNSPFEDEVRWNYCFGRVSRLLKLSGEK